MVRNGDRPQTVGELATQIGADPILLGKYMYHVTYVVFLLTLNDQAA